MKIKIETENRLTYNQQVEKMDFHFETENGDVDYIYDLKNEELKKFLHLLEALENKVNAMLREDDEVEKEEEY